jgi:hypothetical protein
MDITGEINIIDPKKMKLYRDSFNELKLEVGGEGEYSDVKITRLFPVSDPQHYICFKGVKKEDEKPEEGSDAQTSEEISEDEAEEKQEGETSKNPGSRPKEIGIVKDIKKIDSQSRKVIEEELAMMYFTPKITRIHRIKSERGSYKWVVETDKGEREFDVRHREDIRVIESNRVVVKDVDGNRFEIPNYSRLDSRSKSTLERYM